MKIFLDIRGTFVGRFEEGGSALILSDQQDVVHHDTHSVHLWYPQVMWWHELLFYGNVNVLDFKQ